MTENEKLVWAAVYAKHWTGEHSQLPTAVDNAWAAVKDMRDIVRFVAKNWGEDHEVYAMLMEMTHE